MDAQGQPLPVEAAGQRPPKPETGWANRARLERLIAVLLLAFAVTFNLIQLYPEIGVKVPWLNDGVLHLINLQRTSEALAAGQDPTDHWLGAIALGYPLLHHYQHLPYLLPALASSLAREAIPAADLLRWITYLLISLFPLSIYFAMRWFGFSPLPSALAGLLSPLLSTNGLYGLEYGSYVWRGYGLYTQLWGMVLLPMALARTYRAVKDGQGYFWAVVLLAATVLSHVVLGYVAVASAALFVVLGGWRQPAAEAGAAHPWTRAARLALLLVLVGLVAAYFVLPFLSDSAYLNRSVWERADKYDSLGYEWVLGTLLKGELFDYGRLPVLTILAAAGLAFCLWRWRDERCRAPVVLTAVWLALYFGRPTWGVLLDLLPLGRDLQFHRLIAGAHLGGIFLMGLGLALPWSWALARRDPRAILAVSALTALVLFPAYQERTAYLAQNAHWMEQQRAATEAEQNDLSALIETLKSLPPGRAYAGLPANWGKDYKIGSVPMYALLNSAGLDMLGYLYHALSLNADIQVLFQDGLLEQYDLFNVRYVLTPSDFSVPGYYKTLQDFGRHRLYEIPTTGYFDLVGSDLAYAGDKADWFPAASAWLNSGAVKAKQHPAVYLDAQPDGEELLPLAGAGAALAQAAYEPGPARGRILSETASSGAYAAEVEVARDSLLMLKATYHPGWRASVDGIETTPVMLMPSYIGVPLSPGAHQVVLAYQPGPARGVLQAAAILALLITGVVEWRRERISRWLRRFAARQRIAAPLWFRRLHSAGIRELKKHLPYLAGVAALALLASLPMLQLKQMSGHDTLEYLPRNTEFVLSLSEGHLLPRWAPNLNFGYGEPFFNFNPPLIYYLSALFHGLGFSLVAAENLACLLLLFVGGLSMYLLAQEFFGPLGGLVSAGAFVFAPYVLVALYVRHALADFAALMFLPLTIWGIYHFARWGRLPSLFAGSAALALLVLSSNPIALVTAPFLALLVAGVAWRGKSWRALWRGAWGIGLGLGLSAFFWLPALAERELVHTRRLLEGYLNYRNHFAEVSQLFHSPWGYGLSMPGPDDGMSFAMGWVYLAASTAALVLIRRIRARSREAAFMVAFALILVLAASFFTVYPSQFIWDRLTLLQYLEFPWRFLALVAVGASFAVGFPLLLVARESPWHYALAAVLLLAILGSQLQYARPETFYGTRDEDYSPQAIAQQGIAVTTALEYQPVWVQEQPQAPANQPVTIVEGQGRIVSSRQTSTKRDYRIEIAQDARLRLNTFYFPGWTLYVDGVEQPIEYGNPQGVMEFTLPAGLHEVTFMFHDTPVRTGGKVLALAALLMLALSPRLLRRILENDRTAS